jgi:retron-type reverse transcriptase
MGDDVKDFFDTIDHHQLKTAIHKDKNKYLEIIFDEIIEFQRTGCYDLVYMKTKELGSKENNESQSIGI